MKDYQIYSALASPIFTKQDLQGVFDNFDKEKGNLDKEDLLGVTAESQNWGEDKYWDLTCQFFSFLLSQLMGLRFEDLKTLSITFVLLR